MLICFVVHLFITIVNDGYLSYDTRVLAVIKRGRGYCCSLDVFPLLL